MAYLYLLGEAFPKGLNLPMTRLLVKCGLDVDEVDSKTNTFIHNICELEPSEKQHQTVRRLMECGASLHIKNIYGEFATDVCVRRNNRKLFRQLLQYLLLEARDDSPSRVNEAVCARTDHLVCRYHKETELMYTVKVTRDFTLLDILVQISKPAYLFDPEVVAGLERMFKEDMPWLKEMFPIFALDLQDYFEMGKTSRYYLRKASVASFSSKVRKEEVQMIPLHLRYVIVEYLSNQDMQMFVESGKSDQ